MKQLIFPKFNSSSVTVVRDSSLNCFNNKNLINAVLSQADKFALESNERKKIRKLIERSPLININVK